MTFSAYMIIGFIITTIKAINSSVVYDNWNKDELGSKIGTVVGLLVCVMIWPISLAGAIFGIFTSN